MLLKSAAPTRERERERERESKRLRRFVIALSSLFLVFVLNLRLTSFVFASTTVGTNITTDGKIGIGNTSPASMLDVSGAMIGKALASFNETGNQALITASASGITKFILDHSGNLNLTTGSDIRPLADSTSALNISNAAGTDFVTFDTTNSRVGISTTSPSTDLSLAQGATLGWEAAGAQTAIVLKSYQQALEMEDKEFRLRSSTGGSTTLFGVSNTNALMRAFASDRPTDSYNLFQINVDGSMYWGPGSTSPDLHFYRSGVGRATINFTLVSTGKGQFTNTGNQIIGITDTSATGYSGITLSGTDTQKYSLMMGGPSETSLGIANKFAIYDAKNGVIRMVIDSTGNIGIGTVSPGAKLEVNGGVRLNTATAKPTCDSTQRGTFWVTQGAAGVKDNVEVCAKDAGDAYAWRTLY